MGAVAYKSSRGDIKTSNSGAVRNNYEKGSFRVPLEDVHVKGISLNLQRTSRNIQLVHISSTRMTTKGITHALPEGGTNSI
jgi:hypothetical protein